jgi:hypothetical protein
MPAPFFCVLKVNFNGQGFEERYVFNEGITDYTAGLAAAQQIAWGRTAFFGGGVTLIYARVSQLGPKADKRTCVLPYPLGPHPSWANGVGVGDTLTPINDPRVCIQMSEESATGQWGNRYLRCIPDSWVTANLLVSGVNPYLIDLGGATLPQDLSPAGNLSHLQVCQNFWQFLRLNTKMAKKNGPTDYTLTTIAVFVYQQITSKKIGKRFRLSAGKVYTT